MAKPLWIAGESGNPSGRPKGSRYSVLTAKGRLERFLTKNMTAKALQALYNKLSAKDQYLFLVELLPYVLPKHQTNALTTEDVERLYNEITKQVQANQSKLNGGKIAG